jgi:hypothetical protein
MDTPGQGDQVKGEASSKKKKKSNEKNLQRNG